MRVKARLPTNAGGVVVEVPDEATVAQFIDKVLASGPGMTRENMKIKIGVPPVNNLPEDETQPIKGIVSSGDVVVVVKFEMENKQAVAAPGETFEDEMIDGPVRRGGRGQKSYGSENDIGLHLLETFTKGGGLTTQERGMKKAFRIAVDKRAEATRAEHRIAAWRTRKYAITELPAIRKFKVVYRVDRHDVEEIYTAFPKQLLQMVLSEVWKGDDLNAKRNLAAEPMAHAQPMFFWSMVRLYNGDVIKGLHEMLPGLNYDELTKREITHTEKYLLNKAQEDKYGRDFEHLEEVVLAEAAVREEQKALELVKKAEEREKKKAEAFLKQSMAQVKKEQTGNNNRFGSIATLGKSKGEKKVKVIKEEKYDNSDESDYDPEKDPDAYYEE